MAGGKFYEVFEKRSTAVDWKLFARALQLVHRTMEERKMLLSERELYRSQGNLIKNGLFQFDSDFMRKIYMVLEIELTDSLEEKVLNI